ncbi:MAG: metallophosphoesterase [Pseudomonadota bacterium]
MSRPVKQVEYNVAIRDATRGQNLRFAVLADLHACTHFMPLGRVTSIVEQINETQPDVVLLLGDYSGHVVGSRSLDAVSVAAELGRLEANHGVFAVFGNHDWRDDPQARAAGQPTRWHRAIESEGITCLCNAVMRMPPPWHYLQIAGLESKSANLVRRDRTRPGFDDLTAVDRALEPADPIILLAHEPDIFPDLPDHFDLTISGHTHGGQILPFGKPWVVPSKYGARYAYGHIREGKKQLVVSGGLGYSGIPIRFRRPPEINMIEVRL